MAGNATNCPDCGSPTLSHSVSRPRFCGACYTARRRQSSARWRIENAERARAAIRAYKEAHREEIRAKGRVAVERDMVCACGNRFQRPGGRGPRPKWCPECKAMRLRELAAEWRARHPEKSIDSSKRGTARRRAAARAITAEKVQRLAVFERDDWTCQICARSVDRAATFPNPNSPSLDHVIPLSKGGDHTYANVQLACLRCNLRKGDRIIAKVG